MEVLVKTNPLDPVPLHLKSIQGIEKLGKSIKKELQSPVFKEQSSNLPHLLSIVNCVMKATSRPSAVMKPFSYSRGKASKLIVDIVSTQGDEWFKVSARNPKSLALLAAGGGNFGQKSILDHAKDYIVSAKENPCFFKPPKVTFIFTSGISVCLAETLERMGVSVEGEKIEESQLGLKYFEFIVNDESSDESCEESSEDESSEEETLEENIASVKGLSTYDEVKKLNLDITALLAFVSNLTNGHEAVNFKKPILYQQSLFERERPQKPILEKYFEGRELHCCETAYKEFQKILTTVGGPEEQLRAAELLERVSIIPDQLSERTKRLCLTGNIKPRSLVIFGSGDYYQCVTVSSNTGFVRSAQTQGVDFPVFLHESRALTEEKESLLLLSQF